MKIPSLPGIRRLFLNTGEPVIGLTVLNSFKWEQIKDLKIFPLDAYKAELTTIWKICLPL